MERVWRSRIYSETLAWSEVVRPSTIALLARFRLELVLAVRPWDLPALGDTAKTLRDAGIPLSAWPMLADEDGRWVSVHNAHEFRSFALRRLRARGPPADVLFDLEPPFAQARALAQMLVRVSRHRIARRRGPSVCRRAELAQTAREIARAASRSPPPFGLWSRSIRPKRRRGSPCSARRSTRSVRATSAR